MSKKTMVSVILCMIMFTMLAGGSTNEKQDNPVEDESSVNQTAKRLSNDIEEIQAEINKFLGNNWLNMEQPLTDKQLAIVKVYDELVKNIYNKHKEDSDLLAKEISTRVSEIYKSIVNEDQVELNTECSLCNTYSALVNGFYESNEYILLNTDLQMLMTRLAALKKGSDEYNQVTAEIRAVWGKISILAGEINSKINLLINHICEFKNGTKISPKENKEEFIILPDPLLMEFEESLVEIEEAFI